MSDDPAKPVANTPNSEEAKPPKARRPSARPDAAQPLQDAPRARANPIVADTTYGALREESRVVMRHQIALNIDTFRAAPADFAPRPQRSYPPLRPVTPPFLSVIIPNFNGLRFLPALFAGLHRQTLADFEVILADDASHDGSVAWVEEHYPAARVLVNRRNLGFVATCNAAADAARGRILVFLNNDTEPEAEWLAELARAVCHHPEAAIFASKLLLFDQRDRLHAAGDLMGADGIPRNRGVWEVDSGQYDGAVQVFSGCGGATAYRRDVWTALGGFDEDFWMYVEDVDLAFRAQLAGWQAVFVPTARVYHHLSATGGGALASYYVGRNTIWNVVKNMPRGLLLRNGAAIVAAQLAIAADALRNMRGEAARARLLGQLRGVLGLRRPLQKRRLIQVRRLVEDGQLAARLSSQ